MTYFNDDDAFAAVWLRNLYPAATVDERSIKDVQASDLVRFRRVHLFGGIGGWEYALQLAGWPDEWPVWTGSCPCQPFSSSGKRKGEADDRHLWPEMFRIISECRPAIVFGEQVTSKDGLRWLDGVFADLEGVGYACGAADLCAASAGSPQIRQRLFWVACANGAGLARWPEQPARKERASAERGGDVSTGGMASAGCVAPRELLGPGEDVAACDEPPQRWSEAERQPGRCCEVGRLGSASGERTWGHARAASCPQTSSGSGPHVGNNTLASSTWDQFRIVPCGDDKLRRVSAEPGAFPLAPRIPRDMGRGQPELGRLVRRARSNRVGRQKGYGNAIVPQVAAEFIRAVMADGGAN